MSFTYKEDLLALLSTEYHCAPRDFLREENVLTVSALCEGRRAYGSEPYFFHMVTMGGNAVVTADERLHPFLREFIRDRAGHWLFELPNLRPLGEELRRFGYALTGTFHMFLPCAPSRLDPPKPPRGAETFTVRWFTGREIDRFYGDERFPNAICERYLPHRPDKTVIVLCDGEQIVGMAGCSVDAPRWEQIGIDVLPAYRSRGIGTYLVALLRDRILSEGSIPFYGTSVSNYHSWNIALNCGFRPAWVEIGANPTRLEA